MPAQAVLNLLNGRCGDAERAQERPRRRHHAQRSVRGKRRLMVGVCVGLQSPCADRMVEPGRRPRPGGLEAGSACPAGSRRPADRQRPATHPQDAQGRHRRTAGCAPTSRHSIYRAQLTLGWPQSRQSRRSHRAMAGCCPALRREEAETRRRHASRAAPRRRQEPDPESRIKSPRPEASARWSQGREAQKLLELLKIDPATARQPDLIADPGACDGLDIEEWNEYFSSRSGRALKRDVAAHVAGKRTVSALARFSVVSAFALLWRLTQLGLSLLGYWQGDQSGRP